MKLTFSPWFALLVLGLIGCDSSAASETGDSSATAPSTSASAKPAPEPDKPEEAGVTVIGKGEDSRTQLRYAPKPGQAEFVKMTTRTKTSQIKGKEEQDGGPGGAFTLKLTFKEKKDDALVYGVKVEKIEAIGGGSWNSAMVRQAQKTLDAVVGLEGTLTVSDRGLVRASELVIPDTVQGESKMAAQNLNDSLRTVMFLVLPTARVGVGAKWEHKSVIHSAGMKLDQADVFTLVRNADGKLEVESTSQQTAKDQTMEIAPGVSMTVFSIDAKGTSSADLDLEHLAPLSRKTEMTSQTVLQQGSRPKKEVATKTTVTIEGGID